MNWSFPILIAVLATLLGLCFFLFPIRERISVRNVMAILIISTLLFVLGAFLICLMIAPSGQEERPPIPRGHVMVGSNQRQVQKRTWCGAEKPCTMSPIEGAHWEVNREGEIKIVYFDEELRFERGYFEKRADGEYPHWSWVHSDSGDYLLAKAGIAYAYIIHYPKSDKTEPEESKEKTALEVD